jgi:hypothetical protein
LTIQYLAIEPHCLGQLVLHLRQHLYIRIQHERLALCRQLWDSRCFVAFSSAFLCSFPPTAYACSARTWAYGNRCRSRSPYAAI